MDIEEFIRQNRANLTNDDVLALRTGLITPEELVRPDMTEAPRIPDRATSPSTSTQAPENYGFIDALSDAFQGGQAQGDADRAEIVNRVPGLATLGRLNELARMGNPIEALATIASGRSFTDPYAEAGRDPDFGTRSTQEAKQRLGRLSEYQDRLGAGPIDQLMAGILDASQSPEGLATIANPLAGGALAAERAFAGQAARNIRGGAGTGEAIAAAVPATAAEFLSEYLLGRVGALGGRAGDAATGYGRIAGIGSRIGKTAASEGASEAISGTLQEALDDAIVGGRLGSEDLQRVAAQSTSNTAKEFFGDRYREFRAGAIAGGGLRATTAAYEKTAEQAQRVAELIGINEGNLDAFQRGLRASTKIQALEDAGPDGPDELPTTPIRPREQPDLFNTDDQRQVDMFSGELGLPRQERTQEEADRDEGERQRTLAQSAPLRTLLGDRRRTGVTRTDETTEQGQLPLSDEMQAPRSLFGEVPQRAPLRAPTLPSGRTKEEVAKSAKSSRKRSDAARKANLSARENKLFNRYVREGMSEEQAYREVVAKLRDTGRDEETGEAMPADQKEARSKLFDGLASRQEGLATPRQAVDVVKRLVKDNTREAVAAQNAIRTGKIIVANNDSQMPDGARQQKAMGWFDGKKMYLNAARIPKGQETAVALHEGKHYMDRAAGKGKLPSKFSLQSMLGDDANRKAVEIIGKAAQAGNSLAQRAVARAQRGVEVSGRKGQEAEALFQAELPAYFTQLAVEEQAKGKPLGRAGAALRDIQSGIRNFARNKLNIPVNITANDLQLLTRRMSDEIQNTDLDDTEGEDGLATLVGERGGNFQKYLDQGIVFEGAVDGLPRAEISDRPLRLRTGMTDRLKRTRKGTLGMTIDHPELFENYPDLRGTVLEISEDSSFYAQAMPNENTIYLSEKALNEPERLRKTIVHEVQHLIQHKEGFTQGATVNEFLDPKVSDTVKKANKDILDVLNVVDPETVRSIAETVRPYLDPARKLDFNKVADKYYVLNQARKLNRNQFAREELAAIDQLSDPIQRYEGVEAQNKAARSKYMRTGGEAESRAVEARLDLTDDERLETPFYQSLDVPRDELINPADDASGSRLSRARRESQIQAGMASVGDETYLGSTARITPEAKNFLRRMKDAFGFDTGLTQASRDRQGLVEKTDRMRSTTGASLLRLITTTNRFNSELKKAGPDAENRLQAIEEIDEPARRESALRAFTRDYPLLGRAYFDGRTQLDDMSKEILRLRARSKLPLTKREIAVYSQIKDNIGRYYTRLYAANKKKSFTNTIADKLGLPPSLGLNSYGMNLMKKYAAGRENELKRGKDYDKVADAIKFVTDNHLTIPDEDTLLTLPADKIRMYHDIWVGRSEGKPLDEVLDSLVSMRETLTPEQIDNRALLEVEQLLGVTGKGAGPIFKYYRGAKQDRTILTPRADVPKVIRDLLGEYEDVGLKMLSTGMMQANFIGRTRMLTEIAEEGIGKWVIPADQAGKPGLERFTHKLSGPAYGPLDGMFATPETFDFISDGLSSWESFETALAFAPLKPEITAKWLGNAALQKVIRLAGLEKFVQVVLVPANVGLNFAGGGLISLMNGNVNPKYMAQAGKAAGQLILAQNKKHLSEEAEEFVRAGILDTAYIGEIQRTEMDKINSMIQGMTGGKLQKMKAAAVAARDFTVETYALADVVWKMANYLYQKDMLTDFYQKNQETRTAEQIEREAADIVSATNISYSRAIPAVRALEMTAVTKFGTYFSEALIRVPIMNIIQTGRDLERAANAKTPEARRQALQMATRRGMGTALSLGVIPYLITQGIGALQDDDEKEPWLRELLSDFNRYKDLIYLGLDGKGLPTFFDIGRIDPHGPLTDLIRLSMHTGDLSSEDYLQYFRELYIAPRFWGRLTEALVGTASSDNPILRDITPNFYAEVIADPARTLGISSTATAKITRVAETILPTAITRWMSDKNAPAASISANSQGEEWAKLAINTFMKYGAGSFVKVNPDQAAQGAVFEYENSLTEARDELYNYLKEGTSYDAEELFDVVASQLEEEKEAFMEIYKTYGGLIAYGYTPRQADALMESKDIPKEVLEQLRTHQFSSRLISQQSFMQRAKHAIARSENPDQQTEKYVQVWNALVERGYVYK